MTSTEPKKEWELRFDEKFYPITETREDEFHSGRFWGRKDTLQEVRQFISETIASRDEALIEQINSLPSYEVQDDVKTESGEWEEFFQVKVLRKEDILALIRSSREG